MIILYNDSMSRLSQTMQLLSCPSAPPSPRDVEVTILDASGAGRSHSAPLQAGVWCLPPTRRLRLLFAVVVLIVGVLAELPR